MGWFPQQYAETFNALKALVALVTALHLIVHMIRIWPHLVSYVQKLRYVTLLCYALLTLYSSASLAHEHARITSRQILELLVTILLLCVTVASMREWRRSRVP
jgi:hypothetical protein